VWIRGEQQGVSCQVKRAGTAGNVNAADISNQLIVDNQAARTAGTVALAETGKKRVNISANVSDAGEISIEQAITVIEV